MKEITLKIWLDGEGFKALLKTLADDVTSGRLNAADITAIADYAEDIDDRDTDELIYSLRYFAFHQRVAELADTEPSLEGWLNAQMDDDREFCDHADTLETECDALLKRLTPAII